MATLPLSLRYRLAQEIYHDVMQSSFFRKIK
jgi:CRP-like cAMP-binding protein